MTIYPIVGQGPYRTNCYLAIEENGAAVLVDASVMPERLTPLLTKHNAVLRGILLTHAHDDHVECIEALRAAFGAPVWLDERDAPYCRIAADRTYDEKLPTLDGQPIRPLHTPGHTPGSTCLWLDKVVFCGDTLFCGSMGRTDLAGGDENTLYASLRQLAGMLPDDVTLLPGHGESTVLLTEKHTNPYLRYAMRGGVQPPDDD